MHVCSNVRYNLNPPAPTAPPVNLARDPPLALPPGRLTTEKCMMRPWSVHYCGARREGGVKCCMCAQAHRDGAHRGLVQSLGKGRVAAHATDAVARLNALLRQRGGELVNKRNDRQGVAAQRRGRLHVDVVAGDVPLLALGDGRRDQRVRAREQGLRDTQTSFHAALPFSAHRLALAWPPYGTCS